MGTNVVGYLGICVCSTLSHGGIHAASMACKEHGCRGRCVSSSNYIVYQNYAAATCGSRCTIDTEFIPEATGGCNQSNLVEDVCNTSHTVGGIIASCGPSVRSSSSTPFHACSPTGKKERIGSIPPAFADQVWGANPHMYGHVWAQLGINP
jgi:hypothetical protein